jgi:DNA-binding transcriptional MerR regulator
MNPFTEPDSFLDEQPTYSSVQVSALTGASFRQLDYWCRTGRITDTASGQGSQRKFGPAELDLVHHAVGLIRAGFTVNASLRIAADLVEHDDYSAAVADIFELAITTKRGA